jgi:CheY-like chemotaxis protein
MSRVLLVDDEPSIRFLLAEILRGEGFAVMAAGSAAEARQRLEEEVFDLVVTDLRMETPTAGFEVVQAAAARTPRPGIVILTAFPVPLAEWRPSGADLLFVKGGNIHALDSAHRKIAI